MSTRDLFRIPAVLRGSASVPHSDGNASGSDMKADGSVGKRRGETVHRLQVGLSGLAAMILLVGLANIIQDRARMVEEQAVPEAAPTVEPAPPPPQRDPLADAGVVPDLPAEPTPSPSQQPAILPEQGDGGATPTP